MHIRFPRLSCYDMPNRTSLIICILALLLALSPKARAAEKTYTTNLPAYWSWTPVNEIFLTEDTTGLFPGKMSAQIGTLTLTGWNPTATAQSNYNTTDLSQNYVRMFYWASGPDGKGGTNMVGQPSYNGCPNQETITGTINGTSYSITLYIGCVSTITSTMRGLSAKDGYYTNGNNPAVLPNDNSPQMYAGGTITYYLYTQENATAIKNLPLYHATFANSAYVMDTALRPNLTGAWRDINYFMYRINANANGGSGRYLTMTGGADNSSLFSPLTIAHGISIGNHNGEALPEPDWTFTITKESLADRVALDTDSPQEVATATLTVTDTVLGRSEHCVNYSFTDNSGVDGSFAMKCTDPSNVGTTIPFGVRFSIHSNTGDIVKGQQYRWWMGSDGTQTGTISITGMQSGSQNATAGTWQDTITVNIITADSYALEEADKRST